ncbi:hypothetical protein Tco_1116525, partial [Tanacetum coccineum]
SELKLDGNLINKVAKEAVDLSIRSWRYLLEILVNKKKDVKDLLAICPAPNPDVPSSSHAP